MNALLQSILCSIYNDLNVFGAMQQDESEVGAQAPPHYFWKGRAGGSGVSGTKSAGGG